MLPKLKVANRTVDELKIAKAELDAMFEPVKGKNKKLNPAGVKEIDDARYVIAELVVQLINDQAIYTDPTGLLVESTTGDIRDQYIWRELNSTLRVVRRSYGTKPLSQRLTFKEFGMSTSHKEVNVEIPLEEIAAGVITPSLVVEQIADAINRDRITMVLNAIDAGVTAGADQTGVSGYTKRYTGFTQANVDKAIDGLQDNSVSPVMFGRHVILAPVVRAFTGFSDDNLHELNQRGVIGVYHGCNIVTLQDDVRRFDSAHAIPTNRVWLGSATKGAVYMSKDVSFLNYSLVDPRTSTFATGVRLEDGVMVWRDYNYRVIEV
jgi:hypothetical protein